MKKFRIIKKTAQSIVASGAEDSTDFSGIMVMINVESSRFSSGKVDGSVRRSADGANASLSSKDFVEVSFRQAVGTSYSACVCAYLVLWLCKPFLGLLVFAIFAVTASVMTIVFVYIPSELIKRLHFATTLALAKRARGFDVNRIIGLWFFANANAANVARNFIAFMVTLAVKSCMGLNAETGVALFGRIALHRESLFHGARAVAAGNGTARFVSL